MTPAEYTRYKTIRFTPASFLLIENAAMNEGMTTSEYIRDAVLETLPAAS